MACVNTKPIQTELAFSAKPSTDHLDWERFPKTRYLGSKRKLLNLLQDVFSRLEFDSALDPFSGTGAVAYLLKTMGKSVTASDALESNVVVARALVVNNETTLDSTVDSLVGGLPDPEALVGFIERTFDEVFFERDENRFIDGILPRIRELSAAKSDLALYTLFQACLAKRPYNLFHRANLSMRRKKVSRSFGNKTTWERPFPELIKRFAAEADGAVFDSGRTCHAIRADVLEIDPAGHDLVYFDPPYVSAKGARVDYLDYYHFLEGLCSPENWEGRILHRYKHKPLEGKGESPWSDPKRIEEAFESAVNRFSRSTIVISYRSDGIPSIDDIAGYLEKAGKRVEIINAGKYTYALSRNRRSREVVLVGR
ncbi:MAG: DNA methyltransferase [Deltaproteobacteria bacterium]|nr:DNA methyltransferase [Deltaproteobacteria bacterium]